MHQNLLAFEKFTGLRLQFLTVVTLLCLVLSPVKAGQFDGDYIVEMIVFERPSAAIEPASIERSLRYPGDRRLIDTDVRSGSIKTVTTLSAEQLTLTEEAAKLRKRGFKVLFHKAWNQYIDGKSGPAVAVLGGKNYGGIRELSGYVSLYVKRYLHANFDLWLVNEGRVQADTEEVIRVIEVPSPVSNRPVVGANITSLSRLTASRRMRSSQLHYVDHPQLAILIQISRP